MDSKNLPTILGLLDNTADLSLKRKALAILKDLDLRSSDRILDVGCGDGYYISKIAQLGDYYQVGIEYDIYGLNASERNFKFLGIPYKKLKKWQGASKKGIYLLKGDVTEMPFESNFFSKVIMSEVAEHVPDDLKALKEVYRCTKKGGLLILTVPNQYYPFLWDPPNWLLERTLGVHVKSGFWAGIWNQHIRLYRPEQIRQVVKKAGFKIEKFEVQTKWSLPFNHHLINLGARALAANLLPDQVSAQMNKFKKFTPKDRALIIKLYFALANFADSFNKKNHSTIGTTLYIVARK